MRLFTQAQFQSANANHPNLFHWNYSTTEQIVSELTNNQLLIYFSSSYAKGPTTWYGWSKRTSENFIRGWYRNACILRPYNIYGGKENPDRESVPRLLVDGRLKWVFNRVARDYLHIQDMCDAVLQVLDKAILGLYEVGTGKAVLVSELAEIVGGKDIISIDANKILDYAIPERLEADKQFILPGFQAKQDVREWCRSATERKELNRCGLE